MVTRSELSQTIDIYRQACSFLVSVCEDTWHDISTIEDSFDRGHYVEHLVHATDKNEHPKYSDFDERFHKFPSYLRRAAVSFALGAVSSYHSNLEKWEGLPESERGGKPRLQYFPHSFPTFYKGGMFSWDDVNNLRLKVWNGHDWVWRYVRLRTQDVRYVMRHCSHDVRKNPALVHTGKRGFALSFAYVRERALSDKRAADRRICAVDLGINSHATMSVMMSDGTILARKFVRFRKEEDRLGHLLGHVRHMQSMGARRLRKVWAYIRTYNSALSKKVAHAVVEFARDNDCDVVVMEYLDMAGKVRGSRKQRLSVWRCREIQRIVENQAHVSGMRFSRVCAANTSKLAFDGSGEVVRGKEAGFLTYALCKFSNGKVYNCDLNASYNIGSRYFIRELLKTLPVKVEQGVLAKVPELSRRTRCTLSSLINMNAELTGLCLCKSV
jgi:IS605 OrfB family transposase